MTSGLARVAKTGPRLTFELPECQRDVFRGFGNRREAAHFLKGPVSTQPPPFPGGMQFRPVGRALVQL